MTAGTARVAVIMVTYNSGHIVRESLTKLPDAEQVKVIVVDNLSTDDSVEVVEAARPDATVILNSENAGFARAVNLGAKAADSEFLLLLNPDAYLSGASIATLVGDMDADAALGIAAPLMTDPLGKYSTIAAGHAPTIWRMALHASGISRFGKWVPFLEGHYLFRGSKLDEIRELDWVSGGCLLIRKSLWDSLGGLSTKWFMYAEDVELCLRARRLGFRVVVDPRADAIHDFGGSSKEVVGKANPTWVVNLYDLYSTSMAKTGFERWLWKHTVAAGFAGRAATYRILRRLRPKNAVEYDAQVERYGIFRRALLAASN